MDRTEREIAASLPQWKIDESAGLALQGRPLFFFKTDAPYGYFCQWYLADFADEEGRIFNCAEQYMMYHKAKTFGDGATMAAVMKTKKPVEQKTLGKNVRSFSATEWDKVKFDVVVRGSMLKFTRCVADPKDQFVYGEHEPLSEDCIPLQRLLLATGDLELCEASHFDRVWGIGYSAEQAKKHPRRCWGENLLGKALMEVRSRLRVGD